MNDFKNISNEFSNFSLNNKNFFNSIKIINEFFSIFLLDYKNYIFNLNNNISSILSNKKIENLILFEILKNLKKIFDFYIFNSENLIKFLNLEIIKPFSLIVKNYENSMKKNEKNFNDLIKKLNKENNKLNFSYKKFCNSFFNIKKFKNENEKNFFVSEFFNCKNLYNYNLIYFNCLIDESNKNYNILINDSIKNKIDIINKIKFYVLNFNQKIFDFDLNNNQNQINNYLNDDTINKILDKIKSYNFPNENRFKYENFKTIEKKNNVINDDFEIINKNMFNENETNLNKEIENKIDEYLKKLQIKEEFNINFIQSLMNFLKEKKINYLKNKKENFSNFEFFIEKLKNKFENKEILFKNNKNLIHFGNILNSIFLNLYENFNENLKIFIDLNKIIIKIYSSEFFLSFYLIKINKIFSLEKFWKNLFMFEIIKNIENFIENDLNKINEENLNKNLNNFLFIYLKNLNFSLEKLNEIKKKTLENFIFNKLNLLLKEYLNYFSKFKISKKISEKFLNEIFTNFNFFSTENKIFYLILNINNSEETKKQQKQKNNKKFSFLIDFLPQKNYLNLLLINKNLNKFYYKKIFRNLFKLNRNKNLIQKENIYFSLLKINNIKKKINYKEKLNLYLKNSNKNNKNSIDLDVNRTFFKNNQKENENKLKNILQTLKIIFPKIGYIQGMNFLCAFILILFDFNEEKTFYFMVALFKNSDYLIIFDNNFELLQTFFFSFEKILEIFLPNVFFHMKNNKIFANCYSSSWFITLFTYDIINLNKNKITLFIIENFILEGWKAILNTGFTIINYYKKEIFNVKKENLDEFFNKDLIKMKFFTDECLNVFIEQYFINKNKISKDLINNLNELFKYSNNL